MSQKKRVDMSSTEQNAAVAHSDHTDTQPQLERRLGLSASFSMITGSMLGIGIFLAPGLWLYGPAQGNEWNFWSLLYPQRASRVQLG